MLRRTVISGLCLSDCFFHSSCTAESSDFAMDQFVSPISYHVMSSSTFQNQGFYVVYDTRTRNPVYAVEKLTRQVGSSEAKKLVKRPSFFSEYAIAHDAFRVNPKDYNDSTYDRGHVIPAADFAHDTSLYEKTFSMINISPQASALNQGFWSKFEGWVRNYLLKHIFDEAIVITGPVFAPTFIDNTWVYVHRTIGTFPNLIHVPTHFYKVILGKSQGRSYAVAAFMVPNVDTVNKSESMAKYMVKLGQLEAIGFRFFPNLLNERDRDEVDALIGEERDLVHVFNTSNILNQSSTPLKYWGDIGNPKNTLGEIRIAQTDIMVSKKTRFNRNVIHLCEAGVDCKKNISKFK